MKDKIRQPCKMSESSNNKNSMKFKSKWIKDKKRIEIWKVGEVGQDQGLINEERILKNN